MRRKPRRGTDGCLLYAASRGGARQGIHVFALDRRTGGLRKVGSASGLHIPSFLATHPGKRFLYAVGERIDPGGSKTGVAAAFALDDAGVPTFLNAQDSGGRNPCFISFDRTGKNALVAHYGSGSVAVIPIAGDGRLEAPSCVVQHHGMGDQAHAHSINLDAANKFAFAADLGLDEIRIYVFDGAHGTLTPNDPPALRVPSGSGPRHFAFHPSGKYAYACGEISSTIIAFAYDADRGTLVEQQVLSTIPERAKEAIGNTTAEILVAPGGNFVYVSNRGHDSLAVFSIDGATGRLSVVGHCPSGGTTPRSFGMDPTGAFLIAANQGSDNLVVFKLEPGTGMPLSTGHRIKVQQPVCVRCS